MPSEAMRPQRFWGRSDPEVTQAHVRQRRALRGLDKEKLVTQPGRGTGLEEHVPSTQDHKDQMPPLAMYLAQSLALAGVAVYAQHGHGSVFLSQLAGKSCHGQGETRIYVHSARILSHPGMTSYQEAPGHPRRDPGEGCGQAHRRGVCQPLPLARPHGRGSKASSLPAMLPRESARWLASVLFESCWNPEGQVH